MIHSFYSLALVLLFFSTSQFSVAQQFPLKILCHYTFIVISTKPHVKACKTKPLLLTDLLLLSYLRP